MKKEALLYEKLEEKRARCKVCQRRCLIQPEKRGFCNTRENNDGKIYSLVYAASSSSAVDPIEKKPLFHFYPGSLVYSLGTIGCNLTCKYCQNWNISQAQIDTALTQKILPEEAIDITKKYGCKSIAWTYNEPTMWLEYTIDSAKIAQKEDIKTVYVTNGYMSTEALELIGPHLDAANVDLKGMSDRFYRDLCNARLDPVLENILWMHEKGIHLEITNLIIPGYNDSEEDLNALIKFMTEDVGLEVPLHFSRFFPHYKMNDVSPTPVETIMKARNLALDAGMKYVYVGNVQGYGESTICPMCGETLILRDGYRIGGINLDKKNRCPGCKTDIDIII